jgi:tetratricopeptide (TPR) repeat protein
VWQSLYEELEPKGLTIITVALDTAGEAAAGQWIRKANPTYPCLIDRRHVVADLYDMVNVPMAVWIDEDGRIVRPAEPAGSTDAFRSLDRTTLTMPEHERERQKSSRQAYLAAIRDWVEKGAASIYALPADEAATRLSANSESDVRALAAFALGEYLFEQGRQDDAQKYFQEARTLRPDSWAFKRQAWALEDPAKAGGPEFWAEVEALGDRRYYPDIRLERSQR